MAFGPRAIHIDCPVGEDSDYAIRPVPALLVNREATRLQYFFRSGQLPVGPLVFPGRTKEKNTWGLQPSVSHYNVRATITI